MNSFLEEESYKIRLKYKNIYESLVLKGLNRELDQDVYTEEHHIVPKCLGGSDEPINLVKLTAREHIIAHMLLSKMYPDNKKLITAVVSMTMYSKFTINRSDGIKRVSTRLLSKFREKYMISQKGKRLSKAHREKLSIAKLGKKRRAFSESTKENISLGKKNKRYGTAIMDYNGTIFSTLSDCSRAHNIPSSTLKFWATNIPSRGFKLVELEKESYETHPRAKKIIGPDGTVYRSISECSRLTGHDRHAIAKWILNNPEKGFSYHT